MLKKELTEAHKKLKNPERRINAIYTAIIVSVLWASLVVANNSRINDLVESNRKKDAQIQELTKQNQDLYNKNYQFILDQLQQEKQVKEFNRYSDSVNHELIKIKRTLTSK